MKRISPSLFIVLIITLVWGVVPAPAVPTRALAETGPAPGGSPGEGDPKQAIDDFVASAGQPVGAEEIVSFLNSEAETAASPDFPFGAPAVFNPAATYMHIAAAKLSDTKFVVAYQDLGNSGYGTARVGQVSGTDITYGAEYVFSTTNTRFESVAALSETKFVVAYLDEDHNYGTARIGQVTDTTISYGAPAVFNSNDSLHVSVAALTDTKFVVVYQDGEDNGTARVGCAGRITHPFYS